MVFNEFIERLLQESDKFPLKTLLVGNYEMDDEFGKCYIFKSAR